MTKDQFDKVKGVFYGQAIGDALGLGAEFFTKKEIAEFYPNGLSDYSQIIQDKHRSRWKIGDWTDDTDQFLCLCDSIIKVNGIDELVFAKELFDWFNNNPMGIGHTVYKVVSLPQFTLFPYKASEFVWKQSKKENASNGAIMRTSILGTYEFWDSIKVENNTVRIAKVTHWDNRCVGSCAVLNLVIANIINKSYFLNLEEICQIADRYDNRIRQFIVNSNEKNIKHLFLDEPNTIGYTLKALSAGLWAYFYANSFEEGLLKIVNEGGDADTNACVACSILGAKFGYDSIPKKYINGLLYKEQLEKKFQEYYNILDLKYKRDSRMKQNLFKKNLI